MVQIQRMGWNLPVSNILAVWLRPSYITSLFYVLQLEWVIVTSPIPPPPKYNIYWVVTVCQALCQSVLYSVAHLFCKRTYDVSGVLISTLQIRKPRHSEFSNLLPSYPHPPVKISVSMELGFKLRQCDIRVWYITELFWVLKEIMYVKCSLQIYLLVFREHSVLFVISGVFGLTLLFVSHRSSWHRMTMPMRSRLLLTTQLSWMSSFLR